MSTVLRPSTTSPQHLRMMSVAARLYFVQEIRQREVAQRLGVSQARVSRLLRQAHDCGIVCTLLNIPEGLHPDLEEQVEQRYGVSEVHVVEVPAPDDAVPYALGWAAARFFSVGTLRGATIGFTSWSTTLQELAGALDDTLPRTGVQRVVETVGGLGPPAAQHAAARATQRLSRLLGAEPVYLRTPGIASTPAARESAARDPHVQRALELLSDLDVVFVGVGPSLPPPAPGGDGLLTPDQLQQVRDLGAAGQIVQRQLDADGRPLPSALDDLVVGITLPQLMQARRRVVVAGGRSKHSAIAAAVRGGWVDVLMTDVQTARHLVAEPGDSPLATSPTRP